MKNKFWLRKVGMFLFFVPLALFAFGMSVMYLWNNSLPAAIHVSPINFWQALCMLLLSKILFGGFKGGWGGRRSHWKNDMERKLSSMTPEEKEKFRQNWKNRCSSWGRPNREEARSAKPFESANTFTD